MADNYRQFSEMFDNLKPEGVTWLKGFLKGPDESMGLDEIGKFYCERGITDDETAWPGFDWSFDGEDTCLWIRDEGGEGNIENVITALQRYLKRYEPDRALSLSWAATCSKPRAGEFGGGAVFITAHYTECSDSWDWINHQASEWAARREKLQCKKPQRRSVKRPSRSGRRSG